MRGERKKVVVDQCYELVKELSTGYSYERGVETSNMHEFNMVDDGHNYLQPAWPTREVDLRSVGGPREGYVWDGFVKSYIPCHILKMLHLALFY